jgi:hypothetical protein
MRWHEPFNAPANEQIRFPNPFLHRGFLCFHTASNPAPLALTHGKVRR